MFQMPATNQTASDVDQKKRMQQMLAMGLMNAASAQNPTTSKKAANVNILTQALAGGLGGYMAAKGMGGQEPYSGAFGLLKTNRGSGD